MENKNIIQRQGKRSYVSYIMIPVVFVILSFAVRMEWINTYWTQVLLLAAVNGIVAMSLNLINGMTGQYCLGQAGFMSIGAYISAMCTKLLFAQLMTSVVPKYLLFVVALIVGGLVAGFVGFLIGIPSLRLRGDYLTIITLGFGEIIRVIWRVIPASGGAKGLNSIMKLSDIHVIFIAVVIIMFALRNFTNSRYGRNCISIRENELAAETMGINTTKSKILAFVLSAFIAGIGGGLYSHLMTFINPENFNNLKSTDLLLYLYAGGVGSYTSALLGALLFTLLPEFLRVLGLADWRLVLYSLVLILIMINRPKGVFGKYEFGFMRYGYPENPHLKADNRGMLSSLVQTIKQGISRKKNFSGEDGK